MHCVESELWPFCQSLYRQAGVEPLLLSLQDAADMHIPLALVLIWLDITGRELEADALTRLYKTSEQWQRHVVEPLRQARRWMKANTALTEPEHALREQIKGAELEAERQWLLRQSQAAPSPLLPPNPALTYFNQYLERLSVAAAEQKRIAHQLRQAIEVMNKSEGRQGEELV